MPTVSTYSLAPVTGKLSTPDLLHLLRRCLFGVGNRDVSFFAGKTIDECLNVLLKQSPIPDMLPQEDPDMTDPLVPNGSLWINAPYENDEIDKKRRMYLRAWWVGQLINRDYSLTEKMVLFWHNHFVTEMEGVKDARYSYRYALLLRRHALGNFRELIRQGTTDMAMLVYLNGNSNSKDAPNENYGRELLELFTLGKERGPHYTEDDVKMAARVLSGWKDDKTRLEVTFQAELHDTGDKTFSSFFGNHTIKGRSGQEGAHETDELIDLIFDRKETARFVCRNLYRWLVADAVDNQVEQQVIEPLAEICMQHGFDMVPVLRTLLASEHFFDPVFRGCIVKSPVDFFVGVSRQFGLVFPKESVDCHNCWIHYAHYLETLSMNVGDPPSVAGWPAFHQSPKYHLWWINSYTLGFRAKIMDSLSSKDGLNCNGSRMRFDYPAFVNEFADAADLDKLVDHCVQLLLAVDVSASARAKIKSLLLSGQQTDYYWTEAWTKYMQQPDDAAARLTVEARLNSFFGKIVTMPEFQMM